MGWPIDMEGKGCESIRCYTHFVTFNVHFTHDLDHGFSRSNFENAVSQEWEGRLTWNERDLSRQNVGPMLWLSMFTSSMTLTLDFQGQILKKWVWVWVRYDVGCTMGLTLGHSAWQIDQPSNGSMWNSYNFQPVGQWMGYSFTDLGAEGCCRSLNALLSLTWSKLGLCSANHRAGRAGVNSFFSIQFQFQFLYVQ